jgi:CheY-like chemotaxis protein
MPKLLSVDDQSSLLTVLKSALEDEYDVRCAQSGEEALGIMQTWRPEVVITDYEMPSMTGLDLIRIIAKKEKCSPSGLELIQEIENRELNNKDKKREGFLTSVLSPLARGEEDAGIKIILMSACLTADLINQVMACGADACLSKPFDLGELKRLIAEILEK